MKVEHEKEEEPSAGSRYLNLLVLIWLAWSSATILCALFFPKLGPALSQWGDSSGPFAVLVNIVGFIFVIKSIKGDEARHAEVIKEQQRASDRGTTLALFEKRITVLNAVNQIIHPPEGPCDRGLDFAILTRAAEEIRHSHYLFPEDSELRKFLYELSEICDAEVLPLVGYTNTQVSSLASYQEFTSRTQEWVTKRNPVPLFTPYLNLA